MYVYTQCTYIHNVYTCTSIYTLSPTCAASLVYGLWASLSIAALKVRSLAGVTLGVHIHSGKISA